MIRTTLFAAALTVLAGPAAAQETPAAREGAKAGEQKSSFAKEEFPFDAEVTVERLNVRLFPGGDPKTSLIATVLPQGEKLTVTGETGEFFQILPPRGTSVWIFGRNVKKEAEDAGLVLLNDAPVRLDSRANAEKLATLAEGTKVRILKEHMGWFQIAAPEQVKYFVSKKYVKRAGAVKTDAPPAPVTDAEAKAKLREADELAAEQDTLIAAKQLDGLDFAKVAEVYEAAAAMAKTDAVKEQASAQARFYRRMAAVWSGFERVKNRAEDTIEKLRHEIAEKNKVQDPAWDFTGYIDTVGKLWNRPGAHKLVMGGKIVCFLRTKDGDEATTTKLNNLFDKYVGVRGTIVKDPEGWEGFSAVIVESVEELKK